MKGNLENQFMMMMKMNKYRNKKVKVSGLTFDSKREYQRWRSLLFMEKSGLIEDLKRQVSFDLIPTLKYNGKTLRKIIYKADFTYFENGKLIVEDSKGFQTPEFKIKHRLFLIKYPDHEFRIT